jgi:hypothetical protein
MTRTPGTNNARRAHCINILPSPTLGPGNLVLDLAVGFTLGRLVRRFDGFRLDCVDGLEVC